MPRWSGIQGKTTTMLQAGLNMERQAREGERVLERDEATVQYEDRQTSERARGSRAALATESVGGLQQRDPERAVCSLGGSRRSGGNTNE